MLIYKYIHIYIYIPISISISIYIYIHPYKIISAKIPWFEQVAWFWNLGWLRTNGVNTNGATAKVMIFDRLGKKVRPGTFGKIKVG